MLDHTRVYYCILFSKRPFIEIGEKKRFWLTLSKSYYCEMEQIVNNIYFSKISG